MVEIKKGINHKPAASGLLIKYFKGRTDLEGHLYIGYPILFTEAGGKTIDALWVSKKFGVVAFDLVEGIDFNSSLDEQDKIYNLLDSQFRAHSNLKLNRKELAVNIEIITYAPTCPSIDDTDFKSASSNKELDNIFEELEDWKSPHLFESVLSIIQSVVNLKTRNRRENITKPDSRGAKVKKLENTIATLDNDQEEAVIEFYDGLQRIRGLAGSGKTIVLALKAAYLHAQNPNWKIAVVFNTRSLKVQFIDLINRFCIEKTRVAPDWERIKVVNAWGSPRDKENEKGIYYEVCSEQGIEYFDFRGAERYAIKKGKAKQPPLEVVSQKAIEEIKAFKQKYDAILVDEAQDLSESFLNLCYKLLYPPKRLIYAYDELQKLNEGHSLRNPKKIFGIEAQDTILRKCYRNSKPILVTAHALGFGIYRRNVEGKKSLVQFFDQPQLWKEVGYEIKSGNLEHNQEVVLYRPDATSPKYLEDHSDIDDLIHFQLFTTKEEQAKWVADEIEKNIKQDELLFRDILVINPIALITKDEVGLIRALLIDKEINSHIAGEWDANVFFENNSVTFTGINRAKGNEVPMVYIINGQDCYSDPIFENRELIKRRNILFTAITRSKAWVRVCGVGNRMKRLIKEYELVKSNKFQLSFTYPTKEEIDRMNIIHRDLPDSEKAKINQDVSILKSIPDIIERVKSGETFLEDYPKEIQVILKEMLKVK